MYTNILVPYDKSEHAQRALQAAAGLAAGEDNAKLLILNVTDLPDYNDASFEVAARMAGVKDFDVEAAKETRQGYVQEQKAQLSREIEDALGPAPQGLAVEVEVIGGHAQEIIPRYAKRHECDCIVMGRRGLGAIRGALGSVSYAVLRSTDLPVLIVK